MFDVALLIRRDMKFRIDKRRRMPHQVAFWELPNFAKLLVGGVWAVGKKVLSPETRVLREIGCCSWMWTVGRKQC